MEGHRQRNDKYSHVPSESFDTIGAPQACQTNWPAGTLFLWNAGAPLPPLGLSAWQKPNSISQPSATDFLLSPLPRERRILCRMRNFRDTPGSPLTPDSELALLWTVAVGEGAVPSRHANLALVGLGWPRHTAGATHRLPESC